MKFNKYTNLLFEKIKNQVVTWFEVDLQKQVPNEDVYRFLHSIKGTAGTLELVGLSQIADMLMGKMETETEKFWDKHHLRDFLYELISLSYEYENFQQTASHPSIIQRESNVPVIQLIDDDVSMVILLKDSLEEKGWMVIANTEADKAIAQFFDMSPDCLIIDINLSTLNGLDLLKEFQGHVNKRAIPKVIISINNDRENRIQAYKNGADDFIAKPIDLEEFIVRIGRQIERKKIFDESVLVDELTRVYNRKYLQLMLQQSLEDVKRNNNYFSVALLDLDHFKNINDTYGHMVGDLVLADFAKYMKENVRSTDTVFRYGGEEFLILFLRTEEKEAEQILLRMLQDYSKRSFHENGESFFVTFSAGVHMVANYEASLNAIINTADQALYKAKENGRARVELASSFQMNSNKKKLYVSIIDDDVIIRTMIMKILQSMEIENVVLDIQSFEDGSKFFSSNRDQEKGRHFLILDGIMPIMDGTEVLQKVKEQKNTNHYHVLMLTGRKNEKDIARALKLGADDYVTKPFSITELQARIQRLIQRIT